jgi:LEA14-like dessication related protein
VTWRVVNPNIVPYLLAQATHRIYLDGVLVGSVNDREPIAIPAQTNQERTMPLVLAGAGADRALAAALKAGSAAYRVETNVLVRLYGDTTEKGDLQGAGTVPVANQ